MFTKEMRSEKFRDAETIIGGSIKVKGNFQGQGDIVIEGSLEGSLKTAANLFIGENAKVVANIESADAVVNGEVRGNLKIRGYLSLGGTARINGDIQYKEISIEKGAIINGQLLSGESDKKPERAKAAEEREEE